MRAQFVLFVMIYAYIVCHNIVEKPTYSTICFPGYKITTYIFHEYILKFIKNSKSKRKFQDEHLQDILHYSIHHLPHCLLLRVVLDPPRGKLLVAALRLPGRHADPVR